MATCSLLEMLDAAIMTPRVRVVDSVVLHELLKALIIGQQGQQELSVLEPGQSPTLGLGKGKVTKEKPGQEEKERDICKKRASLQDLWEEINKFKEAQCGLAEDMRAMQKAHSGMAEDMRAMQKAHSGMAEDMRAMQKAHSGMAEDLREMQVAMQKAHSGMAQDMQEMKDAHSGLAEDIQEIQETLGLRGSFSSQATIPGDAQEPAKPWHCSGSTVTSNYELEMQELLSQLGQLGHLCTGLKEQVEQLKSSKAERADLEDVHRLFPKGGQQSITSILANLKCQVSFLQGMARTLHGEEEKRCEKLEEQVESLAQKVGGKVESHPKWRRQSLQQDEQLKCLQASITQLQKDYEKLSSAHANLQQDRQQEQNDIKALERLKSQKADKEELQLLGIDEKADKAALADKVSRSQLEACVERLNKMMEEVTSRVTGQEKSWHQFQQELQRQMDCKLDRRELGAFRQQQEEQWKSLSGQLQEKALQPERDDAAGIKKTGAMATRGLLEMLDAAIGTPRVGVVDLVVLHELLKAIIIGQQGQQELSVLEPGQSPTLGLGKGKVTKEKPGQEEKERDICKKRASLQDLWEEINKFKEAQCGLAEDMRAMQKAHSGMAQDMQEMKDAHSGLAEDIQEIQETLGLRGSFSSQATIPGDAQEPAKPWHCSGSTITSSYELEMQELLSQVGQLGHLCTGVKDQVKQLKSAKAERADLEDVRGLFPKGGRQSITSILSYLKCQMSFLQDMARTLHGEEEKIRKVEDAPRKMRGSGAGRKADGSGQMTQQPRPKGQKDEPWATVQIGGHEQAGCHVCSPDTMVLLGKLLQRCEKLEEEVESLAQKAGRKVESHPMWRRQSLQQDEQLKRLQASIVQLQKDYGQLSSALANLQHDRQQEQNDIKALGRLNKQKADKEELQLLGIDEKADKAALADKVSRSQFEACVERLNEMMEEVTSRVTGQEKGWQRFQQELQRQMDCKLDRRELGAFRQQQEERWKSLRGQLQEKALQPERDDAAGIRKQLLPGFHCLSCDRPVTMLAPGPERTGECKYPTVPQSCGGPHTVRPPRFQPQPPSTPRPPLSRARCPNKVIVPILTNKKNHQGWPQVVSQDIVRHVHNLKSTVFTVVGQVDGKTLLPLPAGSEGIEDVDLENEKSMERIDKSLVYAMESAIIDWSHQIQEALKKESSEPLLQGSDPNPKVELGFWKNRYPEQPGQCMVPCGAHFG
ncbi:hypothetical protein Q9233_007585 [Columba guinea]|nr:hypothetical protein Q9233_007585 [Columba guinea]